MVVGSQTVPFEILRLHVSSECMVLPFAGVAPRFLVCIDDFFEHSVKILCLGCTENVELNVTVSFWQETMILRRAPVIQLILVGLQTQKASPMILLGQSIVPFPKIEK